MTDVKPIDVAKYFLALQEIDQDSGDILSNLKLQKLLYYAQGYHLAKFGQPLFDEDFEAWAYGPVLSSLYQTLKCFGSGQVILENDKDFSSFSQDQKELLQSIYKTYSQFSAWKLRDMTHGETPWKETPRNTVIDQNAIKNYFKTVLLQSE
jgi:uncharacterized phage-associated protein